MYRRISMSHEPIKTYDQFSVLSAVFRVFFLFFFFNFSSSNAYLERIRMEEGMFSSKRMFSSKIFLIFFIRQCFVR